VSELVQLFLKTVRDVTHSRGARLKRLPRSTSRDRSRSDRRDRSAPVRWE
jgi:hypothetical protein